MNIKTKSNFPNKTKCKTFLMKTSFICMRIKKEKYFQINSFALSLASKQRRGTTRELPIWDLVYRVIQSFTYL